MYHHFPFGLAAKHKQTDFYYWDSIILSGRDKEVKKYQRAVILSFANCQPFPRWQVQHFVTVESMV